MKGTCGGTPPLLLNGGAGSIRCFMASLSTAFSPRNIAEGPRERHYVD